MNSDSRQPKFNERDLRKIIAQMYVAKKLGEEPAKVLKFIRDNEKYFTYIDEETIQKLMKEHNVTQEDVDKQPKVKFDDSNMTFK